jgi:radical SAM superfamily enzyme YgiQ (UPF0313 family)
MDFIFISMPYAKYDSKWFANVPNINLGIMKAFLDDQDKEAQTFHFHMTFLQHLHDTLGETGEAVLRDVQQFGVEFLGLDYVFASLAFEEQYQESVGRFEERLAAVGLTLDDFEMLRGSARSFVENALTEIRPYLEDGALVGFSCSHYQLSASLLMAAKIKDAFPDITTVFGGKDCAGVFGSELMIHAKWVDFVSYGECEITISDLLAHLQDPGYALCNVYYRVESGIIRKAKPRDNVDLASLPLPRYDKEDLPIPLSEVILPVELGRGCPWGKCTFCPDASYNIRCQSKGFKQVRAEMEQYQAMSKDLNNFIILDSDALKDSKLVFDLADYLEGKDLRFHFAEFRAERMNRRVLESLLRFGRWISHFQVGIETFSDRVLRLMKKGVSALKNVEVVKMVAELGIPLQFNLFTCYPKVTTKDLEENLSVMDAITHLLVSDNIQMHPGEFYLPTDCPVFLNTSEYRLKKGEESIFADVFMDFPMSSYSNYPYPYTFDNDEEQFQISTRIRKKVDEIKDKAPEENFMEYEKVDQGLEITYCHDGMREDFVLGIDEAKVYLAAAEKSRRIVKVAEEYGMALGDVRAILDDFEQKGLILFSGNRELFLSLATRCREAD